MSIPRSLYRIICSTFKEVVNRGDNYFCPLCARGFKKFHPGGVILRSNAMCPDCGSLERHRFFWAALNALWRKGELAQKGKMLHVAPESALEPKFKAVFDYISIDLDGSQAMQAMDITSLDFPDVYFDAVVCNHVLEHVPDDIMALEEIYRVLKPGGWASLQVPLKGDITFEDPTITDPTERVKYFGQDDHVRQYGQDYIQRLHKAGFKTWILSKNEIFTSIELEKLSIDCESVIIFSLKN